MDQIIEVEAGESLPLSAEDQKVSPLGQEILKRHVPSAHYCLLREKQLLARCSIWTEATPEHLGQSVGVVGHYAAAERSAGAYLLDHAIERLRRRGFRSAIGPMDGNTWRRYRLLTRRGSQPPFFLEPDNPDEWPEHFAAAGFTPLASYFSGLNDDLSITDPRIPAALIRLHEDGVRIRQIETSRFEEELKAVHELSVAAFSGNFLYTPISQAEFLAMYAPLRPHIRPELVLLAEKGSQLVGFVFGLPDLLQGQRGEPITTAIAKSLAVRPGRSGAGLGSVLMDQFQQAARALGLRRVIHALMHESNRSMKISARFGRPFREYTLYSKELGA
jgi:GNAT superfamily N-acetyltransferase